MRPRVRDLLLNIVADSAQLFISSLIIAGTAVCTAKVLLWVFE